MAKRERKRRDREDKGKKPPKPQGPRREGIHPALFALTIVLTLAGAGTAWYFYKQAEEARNAQAEAETERERARNDLESFKLAVREVVPDLAMMTAEDRGAFHNETAPEMIERLRGGVRARADAILDAIAVIEGFDRLPEAQEDEEAPRQMVRDQNKWILNYLGRHELDAQFRELQRLLEQVQTEKGQDSERFTETERRMQDLIRGMGEDVQRFHEDYQGQLQNERTRATQLTRDLDALGQQNAELKETITRLQQSWEQRYVYLSRQNVSLQNRIDELLRERERTTGPWEESEPDGVVIEVDHERSIAYINLGRQHRVDRGMRFVGFRIGRGGQPEWKALLEVIRVEDHVSEARILLDETDVMGNVYDDRNPLQAEDYVANPVYDKDRQPVFVLIGNLNYMSQEEAARLIQRDGGRIDEFVSAATDFLVVGIRPGESGSAAERQFTEQLELARDLQVEIMQEERFLRYLRNYRNDAGLVLPRGGTE